VLIKLNWKGGDPRLEFFRYESFEKLRESIFRSLFLVAGCLIDQCDNAERRKPMLEDTHLR
jgi:hypothetical protein